MTLPPENRAEAVTRRAAELHLEWWRKRTENQVPDSLEVADAWDSAKARAEAECAAVTREIVRCPDTGKWVDPRPCRDRAAVDAAAVRAMDREAECAGCPDCDRIGDDWCDPCRAYITSGTGHPPKERARRMKERQWCPRCEAESEPEVGAMRWCEDCEAYIFGEGR